MLYYTGKQDTMKDSGVVDKYYKSFLKHASFVFIPNLVINSTTGLIFIIKTIFKISYQEMVPNEWDIFFHMAPS